jgi:DNA repair exonuclease SbcCD ATPase subunit
VSVSTMKSLTACLSKILSLSDTPHGQSSQKMKSFLKRILENPEPQDEDDHNAGDGAGDTPMEPTDEIQEPACKRQQQEKARADEDALRYERKVAQLQSLLLEYQLLESKNQLLESKNKVVKQKTEEVERLLSKYQSLESKNQLLESKNEEVEKKTEEVERLRLLVESKNQSLESKNEEVKKKMEEVKRLGSENQLLVESKSQSLESRNQSLESKIKEVKYKGKAEEEVKKLHRWLGSHWVLHVKESYTNPKGKGKRKRSHEDTPRFRLLHECRKEGTYLCCWLCQYVKVVPKSKFQVPQKKLPFHRATQRGHQNDPKKSLK